MSRNGTVQADQAAVVTDLALLVTSLDRNLSRFVAAVRGMAVNDVLDVEAVVIGTDGTWSKSWSVPFAAAAIANLGTSTITVASDPPGVAPPTGPGSFPVGAGSAAVVNMTGRVLTLYGAAGSVVGIQLFERSQPPSFGASGSGPGAAGTTVRTAEPSALLAAGATVNGAAVATAGYSRLRAFAASDVAGTLSAQQARTAAGPWFTTTSQAVAAGFTAGTVLESGLTLAFARVSYLNGAAPQGSFELDSALIAV